MAGKNIDISTKGKKSTPTPEELRRRATGQLKVPPPAKQPPGVKGNPPMPAGKFMKQNEQGKLIEESMTELEKKQLLATGWKPGQPIPANMADIVAEFEEISRDAVRSNTKNLPPPIDPATPPLHVDIIDVDKMPAKVKAEFQRKVNEALQMEEIAKQNAEEQKRQAKLPPSVREAIKTAQQANRSTAKPMAAPMKSVTLPEPEIVTDDLEMYDNAMANIPEADKLFSTQEPEEEAPSSEQEEVVSTGVENSQPVCNHCGWPVDLEDIAEPAYHEKMQFLHAWLGEQPFTKEYDLFNGAVTVTLRTLTVGELDAVSKQLFNEQEQGKIKTVFDVHERRNRYRLYLGLKQLRSMKTSHDLPNGFTPTTSPQSESHWDLPPAEFPEDTGLQHVEEYILTNVIKTESVARVLTTVCNRFNRLVAKLEAMVDTTQSDFWSATGEPS